MGTITPYTLKDGTVKYKAEVSVRGRRESNRFRHKPDARRWVNEREIELNDNPNEIAKNKTTTDVFKRYAEEESPRKGGARWEQVRLNKLCRSSLGDIPLAKLSSAHADAYIAELEGQGLAPNSIIREMAVAKTAIKAAVKWNWLRHYPWKGINTPHVGDSRDVLITRKEVATVAHYANIAYGEKIKTKTQQVGIAFLFAIETAMRLGEICKMTYANLDVKNATIRLPGSITKNGTSRTVPLSPKALELIGRLPKTDDGRIFGVTSTSSSVLFRRIRKASSIRKEITFHDTRHLALTNLAEMFDVMELCRISGHKNPQQLLVHYNKSAVEMAKKFRQLEASKN